MEQFSLDKWLQDKSRKVVTRRGNPVRIICTDRKHGEDDLPIVFLEESNGGEFLLTCKSNGRIDNYDTQYDLFFVNKKEELSELQKTLEEDCDYYVKLYNEGETREELREWIKGWCPRIIDLARKEIQKEIEDGAVEFAKSYMEDVDPSFEKVQESEELWKWKMSCLRGINKAYTQGKQDVLEELPKLKKIPQNISRKELLDMMHKHIVIAFNDCVNYYYIDESDLRKLPKEE